MRGGGGRHPAPSGGRPGVGDPADETLPLLGAEELAVEVGLDVSGRDRVDPDRVPGELRPHRPGELHESALRGHVFRDLHRHPAVADHRAMLMMLPPWPPRPCAVRTRGPRGTRRAGLPGHRVPVGLVVLEERLVDDDAGVVTSTSIPPRASAQRSTPARTEPASDTSMPTATASPPAAPTSPASASRRSVRRATSATRAPSPARVSANCRPRPEDARSRWRASADVESFVHGARSYLGGVSSRPATALPGGASLPEAARNAAPGGDSC